LPAELNFWKTLLLLAQPLANASAAAAHYCSHMQNDEKLKQQKVTSGTLQRA